MSYLYILVNIYMQRVRISFPDLRIRILIKFLVLVITFYNFTVENLLRNLTINLIIDR